MHDLKGSDSHAVGHPRPSRLDRTGLWPSVWLGWRDLHLRPLRLRSNKNPRWSAHFCGFELFKHPSGSV